MGGSDLFTGTLDLLILRTLKHRAMHAYGVGKILRDRSRGELDVAEGVLYPALHRLEARGLLTARWAKTDAGRRAKYYEVTAKGRAHLAQATEGWERFTGAVKAVLDLPPSEGTS
jgi:PadR family transcriptional regulator PadR